MRFRCGYGYLGYVLLRTLKHKAVAGSRLRIAKPVPADWTFLSSEEAALRFGINHLSIFAAESLETDVQAACSVPRRMRKRFKPWVATTHPGFLVSAEEAVVVNNRGDVALPIHRAILDDLYEEGWDGSIADRIGEDQLRDLDHAEPVGPFASLVMPRTSNYYHWMFQGLPRAILLQRYGLLRDQPVFLAEEPRAFALETLAWVGINADQLRMLPDRPIRGSLLTTSIPSITPSQSVVNLVRSVVQPKVVPGDWSRIFVDRGANVARKITNDEQFSCVAEEEGFTRFEPGRFSVAEQAYVFSQARTILAVHGASLTNLLFCQPGTAVIEVVPANFPSVLYFQLAMQLKLRYHLVVGREPLMPEAFNFLFASNNCPFHLDSTSDLQVPIRDLRNVVREAKNS